MSLADDIINFAIIVDCLNKYADTIEHECQIQQRHNLRNKTKAFRQKADWYLTQLKTDLPPDQARRLDEVIKDADSLGGFHLLEYALMIEEDKRNHLKSVIQAIRDNMRLEIKILE